MNGCWPIWRRKTVQDRIDYHKRLLGEAAVTYAQHDDRIRRIEDTDRDGVADKSTVVANGFNRLEEGTGAGVLARGDDIYYSCIPKLWKLSDNNDDGAAEDRVVLSDGYGVRVAFRGHDMHGLIRGYDGRLYFTIGDRGYHVRSPQGTVLADPASGAVFRCEMDGSNLEVFARGLRNPQEIAFNDEGDWFTVDNNSDSGDQARIVHILQDGDSGWRMYYQYLPDRGPFNRERIWEPANDDQPVSIVPPIENFTDGPSGLVYYPGTGFGSSLKDTFLICDFRGGASNSGIRSFKLTPQGATYQLDSDGQPIWTCLATDVAFGPDGAMYVSDWVDGWDGLGKARIYRITDPSQTNSELVREVETLLAGSWSDRSKDRLEAGLAHADRRVRLESQWELAKRNEDALLSRVAADSTLDVTARRHAIWGLGQIARADSENVSVKATMIGLLSDTDPTLNCAAASIVGEQQWEDAAASLRKLLGSGNARVRYHAIDALGRIKDAQAITQILKLVQGIDADDPAIRHAAIMYLRRAVTAENISKLSQSESRHVRLIAVVALRRANDPAIVGFLRDKDPRVVLEAARAIYDQPLSFGQDALANLITRPTISDALTRRVLNANYRMGTEKAAQNLSKFSVRSDVENEMRIAALDMLASWTQPDPLDRVLGDYRPLSPRESVAAVKALEPQLDLLMAAPEAVRLKAIEVASLLGIKKIAGALAEQVAQSTRSDEARGKALVALARLDSDQAVELAKAVPVDQNGPLALASLTVLSTHAAAQHASRFVELTQSSDLTLRQNAWDVLGQVESPAATEVISSAIEKYLDNSLDQKVRLNVVEAASGRLSEALQGKLATYREKLAAEDPLGQWLDSLAGGDVEKGRNLFFTKTELSCVRCHKVDRAGGEVGPELTVIGRERDARYLLEAICIPDAKIAKGFETAVIADYDGRVHSGIVKTETDEFVELVLNDGSQIRILQDDVEARRKGKSSMPDDLIKHLTPRDLRDLVAYLGSLKVDRRESGEEVE